MIILCWVELKYHKFHKFLWCWVFFWLCWIYFCSFFFFLGTGTCTFAKVLCCDKLLKMSPFSMLQLTTYQDQYYVYPDKKLSDFAHFGRWCYTIIKFRVLLLIVYLPEAEAYGYAQMDMTDWYQLLMALMFWWCEHERIIKSEVGPLFSNRFFTCRFNF